MVVAFIFVFLVLYAGWRTAGTQGMLNCLSVVGLKGTFRKNRVAVSLKPCIDKPPGEVWPLFSLTDNAPTFIW